MGSKKNRQIYLSKRIISQLYILRFIKDRFTRTKTGLEVDFIISTVCGKILPIEVKISENVHNSELRVIKSFMEEHQVNKGWHCCGNDMVQVFRSTQQCHKGYIVCLEERLRKITWGTQEIDIIPLQQFLEKLWNNEIIF